jgi:putative ABC transport system ATP-binding protein
MANGKLQMANSSESVFYGTTEYGIRKTQHEGPMTIALATESVTKTYNGGSAQIRAVDDVSLEVGQGEFVALVGPSGSGKTTLLAMLAALLRASAGSIIIDGQDLGSMSDDQRAAFRRQKIGFTFQANNLVSFLTALENVELMLRLNGRLDREGKARSRELLERLGLGDRLNSLPRQLSGGQQQRVAIARALIHQPSVVLADEPTASLDTERAFQVVETFAKIIREQGRAGVMVTHDLRMCQYVDRVLQMSDGKLVNVITDSAEIAALAAGGYHEPRPAAPPVVAPAVLAAPAFPARVPEYVVAS